ncbi:hypothetical protein M514_07843 [Trichuris suis]|uniref:Uncharacterized protein n=1 Tax=Trichuris suis TaxID=68888 RepID=A0A085N5B8_9BILA|nr:hypothetical protein M513_07843 [Trichuris suis]KFD64664.1 hypothetical protein M514_07843 [Trichuris suis]
MLGFALDRSCLSMVDSIALSVERPMDREMKATRSNQNFKLSNLPCGTHSRTAATTRHLRDLWDADAKKVEKRGLLGCSNQICNFSSGMICIILPSYLQPAVLIACAFLKREILSWCLRVFAAVASVVAELELF